MQGRREGRRGCCCQVKTIKVNALWQCLFALLCSSLLKSFLIIFWTFFPLPPLFYSLYASPLRADNSSWWHLLWFPLPIAFYGATQKKKNEKKRITKNRFLSRGVSPDHRSPISTYLPPTPSPEMTIKFSTLSLSVRGIKTELSIKKETTTTTATGREISEENETIARSRLDCFELDRCWLQVELAEGCGGECRGQKSLYSVCENLYRVCVCQQRLRLCRYSQVFFFYLFI